MEATMIHTEQLRHFTLEAHIAKRAAMGLIDESIWFECEPFPDDVYRFSVKREAQEIAEKLVFRILEVAAADSRKYR